MSQLRSAILSVNSGSSSIKFALYPLQGASVEAALLSGLVDGLEPGGQPSICLQNHQPPQRYTLSAETLDGRDSFTVALDYLRELLLQHSTGIRISAPGW